jgi:hypothetical protein
MRETPPTPPHRNPVNNMSITDQSLKITEKVLWPNIAHCPAKKTPLIGPAKWKNTPQGRTLSYSAQSNPLFVFYMCINKKISQSFPHSRSTSSFSK